MAKQKKKRNKVYSGIDATITRPIVTRLKAANRSKLGQYWFEHKSVLKPILITSGVVIAVIILLVELSRIIAGV